MAKAKVSQSAPAKSKAEKNSSLQKNSKASASSNKPSKKNLLDWYRMMVLIRRFEERSGQIYGMGKIGGFCHLYIGQEAVVVGIQAALQPKDTVITAYRDHGHMLACGMESRGVMAELTGRIGGYSKGKGGSMHMFSREKNFFGGHGIVGAQIPLGAGLAFAHKYKNDGGICVAYFGDGAANQGQIYETMNMASLWKLPILFVLENNGYAMGTSQARGCAGDLSRRGEGFDIPGIHVDGMNIISVYETARDVVEHVRSGKGPMLLEVKTYRYRGHSMSDPAKYRTKEEVDKYRSEFDPINTLRNLILEQKHASEDNLKKIENDVKAIVQDAADFSLQSPEPDASELWTDILIEDAPTSQSAA